MNKYLLIGTLLGDAWIQKNKLRTSSYSFAWQQSNRDYAVWKGKVSGLPYSENTYKRLDKRTKKYYKITHIHLSVPLKLKIKLHNIFYNPKKQVSKNILSKLNDFAIAIWYMDDGSMYYNGHNCHLGLATNGFNSRSVNLIINYFKNIYNISFKKHGKAIRITSVKECRLFMKIVESYIPKCMDYKILKNAIKKHNKKPRKIRANKLGKSIMQLSIEGAVVKIWKSVKEIEKYLSIKSNTIYCNLSGKSKLCNGYKWVYIK